MNATEVREGVISTLRRCALDGSDREIRATDQLGELGLGLDSLALVEFVTDLENRYKLQFSDDFWVERGQLTVQQFIDFIVEANGAPNRSAPTQTPAETSLAVREAVTTREKIAIVIQEEGLLRGSLWILKKLLGRIYRPYQKGLILEYDLTGEDIPQYNPELDVELRIADINDEELLSRIEVVQQDKCMSRELFRGRLESGFICLVACHNGQIVGVDWISDEGQKEYETTGLEFKMKEDSCYALELYEDKRYMGKGIGMALLTYSLAVSRNRGYRRQITWVSADNTPMLSSSVQLLGARKIGELRVRRFFNRPHANWTIEGKKGSGTVVYL